MEFGQLKEYHMRSIYLENFYRKCGRETIARPFLKDENWRHLPINSLKFYAVCCYCMSGYDVSKYIEIKQQTTYFCLIKTFKKTKPGLELVLLTHFLHEFHRKIFILL